MPWRWQSSATASSSMMRSKLRDMGIRMHLLCVANYVQSTSEPHSPHVMTTGPMISQKSSTLRMKGRLASPSPAESPCRHGSSSCASFMPLAVGELTLTAHLGQILAIYTAHGLHPLLIFTFNMSLVNVFCWQINNKVS